MRWLGFLILTLIMLVAQSAIAPWVSFFGVRPDWLLLLVVFFALFARPVDAVLGAWVIGALADLMTLERLGFLALSYGLAAFLVVSVREFLFRYRTDTQFFVVLAVAILVRMGWVVYRLALYSSSDSLAGLLFGECLFGAIYTAVWVPVLYPVLLKIAPSLGIPKPRYTFAGLHRIGAHGV